jgi:hypothetical protein
MLAPGWTNRQVAALGGLRGAGDPLSARVAMRLVDGARRRVRCGEPVRWQFLCDDAAEHAPIGEPLDDESEAEPLRSLRNLSARAGSAAIAALLAAAAGPGIGTAHADEGLSLDDHLVLSYEFEAEGVADGTVTDVSSSGLDGELVNAAAAQIVDGRVAGTGALELSGGAADSTTAPFVQIPRGVFTGRTEASIATWVRWDGGADFQWIYNLGRDNAHAIFLTPSFQGDGRTRSSIKPVNGSTEVGVPGTGKLPTDTWVQAVTTIDGADIVYYLNGVEVGRRAAAVDLAATMDAGGATTSGRIGRALWDGHPYFDGAIDDFRVYDIALDATQVAGLYGEPLPTVEAVGRTQFDVTTSTGQAPKLPATTDATFTDGIGRSVPITWEAIDPQQYAGRGQFTVSGTVTGTGTAVSATVIVRTPGVVEVDLGQETGDFLGGASGTLYGLYDQGLPSNNLVDGIKLKTVATKAQDGPQHPGADALEVLEPIVDSSDGDVYIYMTDIHRGFPYEWPGDTPEEKLSTYLEKIRLQAEQVKTMPLEYQDNVVFMPYNEPEGNMFGTGEWSYDGTSWLDDPQDFYEAWGRTPASCTTRSAASCSTPSRRAQSRRRWSGTSCPTPRRSARTSRSTARGSVRCSPAPSTRAQSCPSTSPSTRTTTTRRFRAR